MRRNCAQMGRDCGSLVWMIPIITACDDLGAALSDVPNDGFKSVARSYARDVSGATEPAYHLYLCGHTHGGQIPTAKPFSRIVGRTLIGTRRGPHQYTLWELESRSAARYTPAPESGPPFCLCGTTVRREIVVMNFAELGGMSGA